MERILTILDKRFRAMGVSMKTSKPSQGERIMRNTMHYGLLTSMLAAFSLSILVISLVVLNKNDALFQSILEPDFDGCHVITQDGEKRELSEGQMVDVSGGFWVTPSEVARTAMPTPSLKGLVVKGSFKFTSFSLHQLIPKLLVVEARGNRTQRIAFVSSNKLPVKTTLVSSSCYYLEPEDQMAENIYGVLGEN